MGCPFFEPNTTRNTIARWILILFLMLIAMGGISSGQAIPDASSQYIGAIPSKFSVTQNGSAIYEIPIDVPPGINGVEPNLSLFYNSQRQNGRLGMGWGLAGLSAITRCPANLAIDGFRSAVNYTESDRFCLDGKRLIVISLTNGQDKSEYRTEVESWYQVIAHRDETCGSGPCSFTVRAKNGTTFRYGSGSGRILAGSGPDVREWALDSVTDLNHNSMTWSYTEDPLNSGKKSGGYYPHSITYTLNKQAGVTVGNRSVSFLYEERPDTAPRFQGGIQLRTIARLKAIQTFVDSTLVKHYQLDYQTAKASLSRSRLLSVTLCDSAMAGKSRKCLTPTRFTWQVSASRFANQSTGLSNHFGRNQGWVNNTRTLADVNGDGRADVVGFNKDGVTVALSTGQALELATAPQWDQNPYPFFKTGPEWSVMTTPRMMVDVNGDGRMDIVGFGIDGVHVALSTGSGFNQSKWINNPYPHFGKNMGWLPGDNPRMLTDVNGDGLPDIVGFKEGVWVSLSQGNHFEDPPQQWTTKFGKDTGWNQDTPRMLTDVNGDGLADIVGINPDGIWVTLSTGSKFVTPTWATNQPLPYFTARQGWDFQNNRNFLTMADVNGDGLTDIVASNQKGVFVSYANGKGFTAPSTTPWIEGDFNFPSPNWSVESTPLQVADVNADGKADLIGFGNDGVKVGLSTGASYEVQSWGNNGAPLPAFGRHQGWEDGTPRVVSDVNGDGLIDIIGFWTTGVELGLAASPYPDLMVHITDGYGEETHIAYAPLSDTKVYRPKADLHLGGNAPGLSNASLSSTIPYPVSGVRISKYPVQEILGGRNYVVSSFQKSSSQTVNPSPHPFSYKYSLQYAQAQMDLAGRGWQGFRTKTSTNGQTGKVTTRTYRQDWPFTGRLVQGTVQCGMSQKADPKCKKSGLLLSNRLTQYVAKQSATGTEKAKPPVFDILRKEVRQDFFDYGQYNFSLGQEFAYDAFGNRILHGNLGYVKKIDQPENSNPSQLFKDIESTDNVFTLREFFLSDSYQKSWMLNYPHYQKVSTNGSLTNISTYEKGDCLPEDTGDCSLTQYTYTSDGTMNLSTKNRWDDTNKVYLTHTFRYDSFGNRTHVTNPAGSTTTTTFEPTYHTYRGSTTQPPNEEGIALTEYYGYDPRFGKLVSRVDFNGHHWNHCYNTLGRLMAKQGPVPKFPEKVKAGTSCLSSALTTNSKKMNTAPVLTLETHDLKIDSKGRIFRQQNTLVDWPTSSKPDVVSQKRYLDAFGRTYQEEQQTVGCEVLVDLIYNSRNQVVSHTYPYCTGEKSYAVTTTYDMYNRVIRRSHPYGPKGSKSTITLQDYAGNSRGTILKQTYDAGAKNAYVRTLTSRYFNGKQKVVAMVVPNDMNATTTYRYDRLGRSISATDPKTSDNPKGLTSTASYDSLSRHKTLDNPTHGPVGFFYDKEGRLHKKTDAHGAFYYGYDQLGRLCWKALPPPIQGDHSELTSHANEEPLSPLVIDKDNTGQCWKFPPPTNYSKVTFYYDKPFLGNSNGKGRQTKIEVTSADRKIQSAYTFGYDAYGHTNRTSLVLDGEASPYVWEDQFTPHDSLSIHKYPDGSILSYTYQVGQLHQLTLQGKSYATFSNYNALQQPRTITFGNGVISNLSYSPEGQLEGKKVTGVDNKALLDLTLGWNGLGQLQSITDHAGDTYDESFQYTNLRLTHADAPNTYGRKDGVDYHYDQAGNLKEKDSVSYTYQGYQMVSGKQGNKPYFSAAYDAIGNMRHKCVNGTKWRYAYTSENRLTKAELLGSEPGKDCPMTSPDSPNPSSEFEIERPLSTTLFLNDYRGRRLTKSTADSTTIYVGDSYVLTKFRDESVQTTRYIDGPAGRVAAIKVKSANASEGSSPKNETLYFQQNHLFSTSLVTSETGAKKTQVTYRPYGSPFDLAQSAKFRPKFTGKELDATTGLYYYGSRYYDPHIGRFITSDAGLAGAKTRQGAFNRYAYVLNNPIKFVDPSGNVPCPVVAVTSGLVIGGGAAYFHHRVLSGSAKSITGDALFGLLGSATFGPAANSACKFIRKKYGSGERQSLIDNAENEEMNNPVGPEQPINDNYFEPAFRNQVRITKELQETKDELEKTVSDLEEKLTQSQNDLEEANTKIARALNKAEKYWRDNKRARPSENRGCGCFVANTEVAIKDGFQDIELIKEGDLVWSRPEGLDEVELQPVVRLIPKYESSSTLVQLTTESGTIIKSTLKHPFWLHKMNSWTPAEDLKPGDLLTSLKGARVRVANIEILKGSFPIYNFEVRNNHNYYVSKDQILVHNISCIGDEDGLGNSTELGAGDVTSTAADAESAETGAEVGAETIADAGAAEGGASALDFLFGLLMIF